MEVEKTLLNWMLRPEFDYAIPETLDLSYELSEISLLNLRNQRDLKLIMENVFEKNVSKWLVQDACDMSIVSISFLGNY